MKGGEDLLARGEIGRDRGNGVTGRHQPVGEDEPVQLLPLGEFYKEHQDIHNNNRGIDDWVVLGSYGVSEGNHSWLNSLRYRSLQFLLKADN